MAKYPDIGEYHSENGNNLQGDLLNLTKIGTWLINATLENTSHDPDR